MKVRAQDERRTLDDLWLTWPVSGPWQFRHFPSGTNNLIQHVDTPSGETYLLKIHPGADRSQLLHEYLVTDTLQQVDLSFSVPAPILTAARDIAVRLSTEAGDAWATLYPLVPGEPPDRSSPKQAYAAGASLAELQGALEHIRLPPLAGVRVPPSYGELERIHPLVADPLSALRSLPLDEARQSGLLRMFESLLDVIPGLYQALPKQLIHGDYAPSNLLMLHDRVSAVLDFEFTTIDLRAMDLAVLLSWWPIAYLESGREWPLVGALAQGYASRALPGQAEIEALPELLRLRAAAALVHRIGRHRAGLDPWAEVSERVDSTLWWQGWLSEHAAHLVRCIHSLQER